jgi:hypothetical protein
MDDFLASLRVPLVAVLAGALGCSDAASDEDVTAAGADDASVAAGMDITPLRRLERNQSDMDLGDSHNPNMFGPGDCANNALGTGLSRQAPVLRGSILRPSHPGDEFQFVVHGASARPVLCLFDGNVANPTTFCGRVRKDPQGGWIAEVDTRKVSRRNWPLVTDYVITTEDVFLAIQDQSSSEYISTLPWPADGYFSIHYMRGYDLLSCLGKDWTAH